jgi:hypothetical protein
LNYYISKKAAKVDDLTDKGEYENQLKEEWKALDDKKMLKFIKKAEADFDDTNAFVDRDKCLSKHFSIRELEILLKNYGMPERIPV